VHYGFLPKSVVSSIARSGREEKAFLPATRALINDLSVHNLYKNMKDIIGVKWIFMPAAGIVLTRTESCRVLSGESGACCRCARARDKKKGKKEKRAVACVQA
jgi:hypothetical protein